MHNIFPLKQKKTTDSNPWGFLKNLFIKLSTNPWEKL